MKLHAAGSSDPQKAACASLPAPSTRPHWQGMSMTGTRAKLSARNRADIHIRRSVSVISGTTSGP